MLRLLCLELLALVALLDVLTLGAAAESCDLDALSVMTQATWEGPLPCRPEECEDLAGKVVLVTGGSTGIGRATAERLAAAGAVVIGTSRWPERHPEPDGYELWQLDQTSDASVAALIQRLNETYGRIDLLHLNAGRWFLGDIFNSDLAAWQEVTDTNYLGTIRVLRAALPLMPQEGYSRVLVSASSENIIAEGFMAPYSASKRALIGILDEWNLRGKLEPSNIKVSIVFIAGIRSNLIDNAIVGCEELRPALNNTLFRQGFEAVMMDPANAGEAFYRIALSPDPAQRYYLFAPGVAAHTDNVCRHLTLPMERWWEKGQPGPDFVLMFLPMLMPMFECPPRSTAA